MINKPYKIKTRNSSTNNESKPPKEKKNDKQVKFLKFLSLILDPPELNFLYWYSEYYYENIRNKIPANLEEVVSIATKEFKLEFADDTEVIWYTVFVLGTLTKFSYLSELYAKNTIIIKEE